jgi:hypothetical protein
MKVDIGWPGKLGCDLRITNGVMYIYGTDHWLEWIHHFVPGARWRERKWARQVLEAYSKSDGVHTISGHSVGGAVACIVVDMLRGCGSEIRLITYGAKRPPFRCTYGTHYAIKGDIVPHLPPWRRALKCTVLDYGKMGFIEAHGPRSYYKQMHIDGVRVDKRIDNIL